MLRANLCTFASETYIFFFIPTRKPETHEKAILMRASRNFWYFGVWNQNLARKTQKWLRASQNFHTFASDCFFTPTRKPENQEKAILIASEPKFLVFLGLKHTILLNILLINHMVCRYINYALVLVSHNTGAPEAVLDWGGGGSRFVFCRGSSVA